MALNPLSTDKSQLKGADLYLKYYQSVHSDSASQLWALYNLGLLWREEKPTESCLYFQRLKEEPQFPLRRLAFLRTQEVCPLNPSELQELFSLEFLEKEPWLETLAVEIAYRRATEAQDKMALISLSERKAKLALVQKERIHWLQQALDIAKEKGDESKIQDLKKQLVDVAPRFNENPPQEKWFDVANDFRRARDFTKARQYYQKLIDSPKSVFDLVYRSSLGLRQTYKLELNKPAFIQATEQLLENVRKQYESSKNKKLAASYYLEILVHMARAYWTEHQVTEAQKILDEAERKLTHVIALPEIYWLRMRIEEEAGRFDQALLASEKGLSQATRGTEIWYRLVWNQAWNHRKLKNFEKATTLFENLKKSARGTGDEIRFGFWHAKTLKDWGKTEEATKVFEEIGAADPYSYYGILAHREMNRALPMPHAKRAEIATATANNWDRHPTQLFDKNEDGDNLMFDWMLSVGEQSVAQKYLDSVQAKISPRRHQNLESTLMQYARVGHFAGLFRILQQLPIERRNEILQTHPDLIFPRPYSQAVSLSANRFGVTSDLIYSIMRQESSFNPLARSPADAFGLMQLIVKTAQESATDVRLSLREPEDLFKPEVNIPLGAAYLKKLLGKYQGQFILTVASYNASEDAVRSWVKSRYREDPLEFIEDIPYDETKTYVKLILRNLVVYMRLSHPDDFVFPEWCLQGLQRFKS